MDADSIRQQIEAELRAFAERNLIGQPEPPEKTLRTVLEEYRRRGLPAVSAHFEDRTIVVEIARPAGEG